MVNFKNIDKQKIVLFSLEELRYALYLSDVVKVERAVEITPLPKAPQVVSGVINYHGEIIPVIDIRKLFRLPQRDIHLEDQFIIARTSQRLVVLVVDSVNGVYDIEHHQYQSYVNQGIAQVLGAQDHKKIAGIAQCKDAQNHQVDLKIGT